MSAAEKSEIGVCGVVGGMMVIELLAGKMRLECGGIAAVEDDMRQTYTVKHIRTPLYPVGAAPIVFIVFRNKEVLHE